LPKNGGTGRVVLARSRGSRMDVRCFVARHEWAERLVIVQILGKFYFVNLLENLWRILFDYGQKLRYPANAAFKAAC
jgi:hypothetical protein